MQKSTPQGVDVGLWMLLLLVCRSSCLWLYFLSSLACQVSATFVRVLERKLQLRKRSVTYSKEGSRQLNN